MPVLNKKITFLIGPDVGAHFYKATDADMSQEEVGPCLLDIACCAYVIGS